jgi:hypothetical protein
MRTLVISSPITRASELREGEAHTFRFHTKFALGVSGGGKPRVWDPPRPTRQRQILQTPSINATIVHEYSIDYS